MRHRTRVQTVKPVMIAAAMRTLSVIQPAPSSEDWKRKSNMPGIHVMSESSTTSTDIFPRTYSARENGRQR